MPVMTRSFPTRTRLLAPLVYLVALLLLFEDWIWDLGKRIAAAIGAWPPLRAVEERVRVLPPYVALAAFVLPGLLLAPVKVLALVAIAQGHTAAGLATLAVAKLGGAMVVARLYVLTQPSLFALAWFARCHDWFMALKSRVVARLFASHAYRSARRLAHALRRALRRALPRRLRPGISPGPRRARRPLRILRRFVAMWRRRRKPNETEHP
jgi:hypothetical protein